MEISENKVYIFKFPYDGTEFTIPVRAESKEDAVQRLQKWMSSVQTELAMEFPQTSPNKSNDTSQPVAIGGVPSEVLEMRIDTLLADLGAKGLTESAKAETVKNWTEKDYTAQNYPAIIAELELIASGQKEVPTKKKK